MSKHIFIRICHTKLHIWKVNTMYNWWLHSCYIFRNTTSKFYLTTCCDFQSSCQQYSFKLGLPWDVLFCNSLKGITNSIYNISSPSTSLFKKLKLLNHLSHKAILGDHSYLNPHNTLMQIYYLNQLWKNYKTCRSQENS